MKKKLRAPLKPKQENIGKLKELLEVVSRGKYLWESTFDAIQDPVLIIGPNYRVERANMAAAERSNHDVRELIGKKCYQIFAQRDDVCPFCPLQRTLQEREPLSVVIDQLRTDADFEVNSYPLVPGTKRTEYRVVHHYRDVTEEKMLQRKLVQSEKMAAIGMLAGGVAHEINNPLGGILAFTQLLQRELPKDSAAQSDLSEIEGAARRCKKIVQDLLTFSRPTQEGDKELLNLNELFEKILTLTRLDLRAAQIILQLELDETLPVVRGAATRLQQVFLNLVTNAMQAISGGGKITVKTFCEGPWVVLEVHDTGCGIRSENLPRIFDPFFTTKGPQIGTGLGLSICYSIILEHQGKIEVQSQEGTGALFRILLPRAAEVTSTMEKTVYEKENINY